MPTNPSNQSTETSTRLERDIRQIERRVNTTKIQLQSELRKIGISPSKPLTDIVISPQKFLRRGDHYGYHQAKKAKSKQRTLQSLNRRLEEIKRRHNPDNNTGK